MLVTHHLLRETPPSPGLTQRLQSVCEPRRRDRLPEEAMSEEARHGEHFATPSLRLSDQRRPTLQLSAGPERADEGGGARRRGGSAGKRRTTPNFIGAPQTRHHRAEKGEKKITKAQAPTSGRLGIGALRPARTAP